MVRQAAEAAATADSPARAARDDRRPAQGHGASFAQPRPVAVEGVRFCVRRLDPRRRTRHPPALLLHGLPQTSACWGPLAAELVRDRVVLAPDLKGLGGSEARGPYDAGTLAREMAALVLHEMEGLPGGGRVDVVGHDWGGSLALAVAGTRPDLVRRLVVISAPHRWVDLRHAWHIPLFSVPLLPEALFAVGGAAAVRGMFRYGWRSSHPPGPDQLEHYTEAYTAPGRMTAMLAYYRAAARPRLAATLSGRRRQRGPASSTCRVAAERCLVLWGAADPSLPLPVGQAVVRDLGRQVDPATVRMVTLPGIGHWPVDEAPEEVLPLVADFLRAP